MRNAATQTKPTSGDVGAVRSADTPSWLSSMVLVISPSADGVFAERTNEEDMGELIEVDFSTGEILLDVPEYDRDVSRLLEDYHEARRMGGVCFDELDEEFARFARAVGGVL